MRDERQIDRAALVEGDEQPFLGAPDLRDGRRLADHVLGHDGGLGRLAGHLVVILQRHDQHGVRVFPEFDEVGHAADDAAVGGFAEGGLVDRAVGADEAVIGPVEFAGAPRRGCASGQPSFCDCRTRRARSRKPTRAARRLPVSVPSAFSVVPP